MRSVLPWTVMRRTDSDVVSRPRSKSQLKRTTTTRTTPPATTTGGRPARRKPASGPEPGSGDMRDALGQGGQLAGGAGLRHCEMKGEEVEIGGVELEFAERAPREQEVGQRCAAPGDGALQPLHHVASEWQRPFHEPGASGE